MNNLTPMQTVAELDKYIVGQQGAKKAVAISLRNRWRRLQLPEKLREEVTPKNIIMIGSTGVGKTEVARRLARLTRSPFVKVEASKFTEVGYVGRDVESMIRDLVEVSIALVNKEQRDEIQEQVESRVEERLLDLLLPSKPSVGYELPDTSEGGGDESVSTREKFRKMLRDGKFNDREVELDVESSAPQFEVFTNMGMEEMGVNIHDAMKGLFPSKSKRKKIKIGEAKALVEQQEISKMIDTDKVKSIALKRAEETGIIFIDEIDKICQKEGARSGADVSREGVQRDLLPIVEGSTVLTKYGMINTDHILFIAAGAFSIAKPSDLLPELQGRFPIRVELDNLTKNDYVRILTEPESSLIKQYTALMEQDGVYLSFSDDGVEAIAELAFEMNQNVENIGARRLHTLMEKVLEEIAFGAPEAARGEVVIDSEYVHGKLDNVVQDKELRTYIL